MTDALHFLDRYIKPKKVQHFQYIIKIYNKNQRGCLLNYLGILEDQSFPLNRPLHKTLYILKKRENMNLWGQRQINHWTETYFV